MITYANAVVSRLDRERLKARLASIAPYGPATRLHALLDRATAVPPEEIPPNVVTMNSKVVVRDGWGDDLDIYILAYPEYDGPRPVYVLSPLGSALLAAREGDKVAFMGATGARTVILESIEYQPERAGDYQM